MYSKHITFHLLVCTVFLALIDCVGYSEKEELVLDETPFQNTNVYSQLDNYIEENPIVGLLALKKYDELGLIQADDVETFNMKLLDAIKFKIRSFYLAKDYINTLIYLNSYNSFRDNNYFVASTNSGIDVEGEIISRELIMLKIIEDAEEKNNYPLSQKYIAQLYNEYPEFYRKSKLDDVLESQLNSYVSVDGISVYCKEKGSDSTMCSDNSEANIAEMMNNTFLVDIDKGYTPNGIEHEIGSAFFISRDGYALTNYHVIQDKAKNREKGKKYENVVDLKVKLKENNFEDREATLIGYDPLVDIALLKIENKEVNNFFSINYEDEVEVGDKILVIGSPFGLANTVTSGIISSKDREDLTMVAEIGNILQIDASVNPGNSGGPLISERSNQVIGVIVAKVQDAESINFAVPGKTVSKILPKLFEGNKVIHSWIGVGGYLADEGFEISYIDKSSTIKYTDIEIGDKIISIDGKKITTIDEVQTEFLSYRPNEIIKLEYTKDNDVTQKVYTSLLVLSLRDDDTLDKAINKRNLYKIFPILTGTKIQLVNNQKINPEYRITKVYKNTLASYLKFSPGDILSIRRVAKGKDLLIYIEIKIIQQSRGYLNNVLGFTLSLDTSNMI